MPTAPKPRLTVAKSVPEALAALADGGPGVHPLAGATWIMRAAIRRERLGSSFIAISRIQELHQIEIGQHEIRIGACATHAELAQTLASVAQCGSLVAAASASANPSIRNVASLGGNLCALGFSASDLIPALLGLDALVEITRAGGEERTTLSRFLAVREHLEPGFLVTGVAIPRSSRRSAHIRLPLRETGDYPVAIVSIAAETGAGGLISHVTVAVGSVEKVARRWESLEIALLGRLIDPQLAADLAQELTAEFQGRDGVEAPGWYRVKVLPTLIRRAFHVLRREACE